MNYLDWLSTGGNGLFLLALIVGWGLTLLTLVGAGQTTDVGVDIDGDGIPDVPPFLGLFGAGRVPVSTLLTCLLVCFGSFGLVANALLQDLLPQIPALWVFPLVVTFAGGGSIGITRALAVLIQRFAPPDSPSPMAPGALTGSVGIAVTSVTRSIGQVRAELNTGTHFLPVIANCRLSSKAAEDSVPRGTELFIETYDTTTRIYEVAPIKEQENA